MTTELNADLVPEGGGVKGIALAGAVSMLEERGYRFRRVAGTSAATRCAPGWPSVSRRSASGRFVDLPLADRGTSPEQQTVRPDVVARTIVAPTDGVSATDFDLTPGTAASLFENGREAAALFLDGDAQRPPWDFDDYKRRFRRAAVPAAG